MLFALTALQAIIEIKGDPINIGGPAVVISKEEFLLLCQDLFGIGSWASIKGASMNFLSSSLGKEKFGGL